MRVLDEEDFPKEHHWRFFSPVTAYPFHGAESKGRHVLLFYVLLWDHLGRVEDAVTLVSCFTSESSVFHVFLSLPGSIVL